jgi:hypothetical protein
MILIITCIVIINTNPFGFDFFDIIKPNNISYVSTSGKIIFVNDIDKIPKCKNGMQRYFHDRKIAMLTLVPFIDASECLPKEVVNKMYDNDVEKFLRNIIKTVKR